MFLMPRLWEDEGDTKGIRREDGNVQVMMISCEDDFLGR